ncbi:uncharacterized protein TNCV_4999021 [Trichonephila clavipes]|nr:uncharacterized protein TNCV_4999021 [Trichonephila clavipes]
MDEQLKALLEGINTLKNSQEETKQEMQKGLENVQKSQEETRKGQEELKNSVENKIHNGEEKINSVEERIAVKMEGKIAVVKEKIEKKVGEEIERIKEQIDERIEEVAGNFIPVPASPVSVKLSIYDWKTNWEVYKTQFCIISKANRWTEEVKACQLAGSLRGEDAEVLQIFPDREQLNLNSLYNTLDLQIGRKYSEDYAHLQMKTRLQKTREGLQEYASKTEMLANLAFSDYPTTVRAIISLQYFVNGLKDGEIQKAVRMADVQDLNSALLYALKLEAATQASRRDHHSIRGARLTAD